MDKHLDFRLAWLSGWAFSWDVFLLVEQRALLWLRLFHAAHGRDAEVPLEAAVLRGCLVAAWPRSQSTRPCSLPGSLPPSEADPRASAVENDNLLIPVHCPGGPFDQGSAVAASFQGTERVQAGTLCQNISDCLMSFPISPQTSAHCTNCIHQIFHGVLTSLFILQHHFTAKMRKEHLGAKILLPFTMETFPKPKHS